MILELTPTLLMQAFHTPTVVVDCGEPEDTEWTACVAFLLWQVEYPEYRARVEIQGRPDAEKALNRALFRRRGA